MGNGYDSNVAPLHVERPIYQQEELNKYTLYEKPHTTRKNHKIVFEILI